MIAGQSPNNSGENIKQVKENIKNGKYLNFLTVTQMINRFLTCDRINSKGRKCLKYTEGELAQRLNITLKDLRGLKSSHAYKTIAKRISVPLVHLYCTTKWDDN